jgi:hypothetical protein
MPRPAAARLTIIEQMCANVAWGWAMLGSRRGAANLLVAWAQFDVAHAMPAPTRCRGTALQVRSRNLAGL